MKLFKKYLKILIMNGYSWMVPHKHGTGATSSKKQAISRSAGDNSSKIHLIVDACGNSCEFIITDGTTHDAKAAPELLAKTTLNTTKYVSADKGYDSENIRKIITEQSAKAIIQKKRNTKANNDHMDWYIYRIRHLVENAFARLKHFRGIATRYDKIKQHYENTVALACAYIWLKL